MAAVLVVVLAALLFLARRTSEERGGNGDDDRAPRLARDPASVPAPGSGVARAKAPLPDGAFSGQVLSWSTGEGVANAHVVFVGVDGGTLSTETDAAGAFMIQPKAPGLYALIAASANGFLPFEPDDGAIAIDAVSNAHFGRVTVYLRPAIEYVGKVEDKNRAPVPGAKVQLLDAGRDDHAIAPLVTRFVTDAKGEFRFHAPAGALLEARHPASGAGRARLDRSAMRDSHVIIRLDQEPAAFLRSASIRGRVVDAKGAPVTSPLVRSMHVWSRLHARGEARGNTDGRFQIDGLDPGTHVVWVVCDKCMSSRMRAETGSDITLVVGGGGTIAGQVIEAANEQPVTAFTLQISRARGDQDVVLDERTVFDAGGRFELHGVASGDYQVRAVARGYTPSARLVARVADTAAPQQLVLELARGGTIHGTVTDRGSGAPLKGAHVTVEGSVDLGLSLMPPTLGATTDASGNFTLVGVLPGRRSIRAIAPDHHAMMISGIQIEDGARLGPYNVKLLAARTGEQPGLEFVGIGARLVWRSDALAIAELVDGGGAQRAGLQVGDEIVEIDGQAVTVLGGAAAEHARGPEGSRVTLAVRRVAGGQGASEIVVERRVVQRPIGPSANE